MCLVFCGDYIIPYIGSVLLFYFGLLIKKFGFLGVRSLSTLQIPWKYHGFGILPPLSPMSHRKAICGPGVFPQIRGHERLDFMSRIDNSGIVKRAQI